MDNKNIQFVKSGITGGHYAFQSEKSDKPFTNKLTEAMLVELRPDDVVVDIGAYVGEYSLYAAQQGVKKVFAYEPTLATFKMLDKNTRKFPKIKPINAAVVGRSINSVELYVSQGIGVTNSIAKERGKAKTVTVPAVHYTKITKGATVVKIDCEGAEYEFDIIQPSLRAIILEFHPIVGVNWQSNAVQIMMAIRKSGFKPLIEPKFENGWDMHGAWVKK